MKKFLLAKKVSMTQIFEDDGTVVPVTILQSAPHTVTQVKTNQKDGYDAVQVQYGKTKKEFRSDEVLEKGATVDVSVFALGDIVKVSGRTKGHGFQGVVKRHGFKGAPKTHGTKHAHREPGSIGAVWPQRVLKGTRMGGRMGQDRVTVRNLKVAKVDVEKQQIYLRGAIPGSRGTLIEIVA